MALRVPLDAHDAGDGDERGNQGAQVAFEDLWRHRAALQDLCQRIVGDAATADDVVQETYVRALRNIDTLEQRPSLMPWLATVARRRSIDELRRRRYQHPVDEMPDEGTKPEHDPGAAAAVSETVAQVREALTTLTDRERELLMRQVNQGMSLAELADADESTVASVRSVLARARGKLREALADAGGRVLAPFGGLGVWLKRKTAAVGVRVQQASPLVPGGYERLGEVATATVTAAALAVGGALVPGGAPASGAREVAVRGHAIVTDERPVSEPGSTAGPANAGGGAAGAGTAEPSLAGMGGSDSASAPDRETEGEGGIVGPVLPSDDASTEPPPDHGEPFVGPAPPAQQPEDTEIEDLDAGEVGHVVALGDYGGECEPTCDTLFRSSDGGATWRRATATGLAAHSILVPPAFDGDTEQRIFAVGADGLLRSTNGGDTFSRVPGGGALTGRAAISPAFNRGDDTIVVGIAPFWSYDAGSNEVSFLGLNGISGGEANFAFAPDHLESALLYAGSTALTPSGPRAAVYECVDGDCEATVVDGLEGIPEVVAYDSPAGDRVVVAHDERRIYVSVGDVLEFEEAEALPLGGAVSSVTVDGNGRLFAAVSGWEAEGGGGLAVSDDDGATWTPLGGRVLGGGVSRAVVAGSRIVAALSVGERGVACSADDGVTWSRRCA